MTGDSPCSLKNLYLEWQKLRVITPKNDLKLHRQDTPNSLGGRKSMYQIQATVALEQ